MPKLTLAYPYVDADGKTHAPDTTVNLDAAEAARLLYYGLARETDVGTPKAPTRRATAKKAAANGPALVGERGPETVNLPRGAQVIPNHQIAAKPSAPADTTKKES